MTIEAMISDLMCDEYAGWTPQGARALAEYMEQLSEDIGEPIEFDRVAWRCDFTEYSDLEEIKGNYWDIETLENLHDQTIVIEFDGGIIIQDF
jgi:hypothetical protein